MTPYLTPTERAIVAVLEAHPGEAVRHVQIVLEAYGYASPGRGATTLIRQHMVNIRRKGIPAKTARARGYYLGEWTPAMAPTPPTTTYARPCQWCGESFSQPYKSGRPWRYCEQHRSHLYRQLASLRRARERAA